MKINKKKNIRNKKIVAASLIILFSIITAIICKNSTNIVVDISNSKMPEMNKANDIPEVLSQENTSSANPQNISPNIEISVTAASQDYNQGSLIIRTMIKGIDGGICVYSISNKKEVLKYESEVFFTGRYYSCNYDIKFSDLYLGKWQLTIDAIQGDKKGTITRDVTIE